MNKKLLDKVLRSPRLPSLPTIAIEVIDLCRTRDINIKQIATTISNDPALSTKVLKTANSSFYGLSQTVSTISHAIVILGLNSVKTLALSFSLVGNFQDQDHAASFPLLDFWRHSLFTAVGARIIARHLNLIQLEEAFLCGLMQDLGMVAMSQVIGESYDQLLTEYGADHDQLWQVERKTFDLDHMQVIGAMADQWKLPEVLAKPIRYHHRPDKITGELQPLARTLHVGNIAAGVFLGNRPENLEHFFHELHRCFDLDNQIGEQFLQDIRHDTNELASLFDIDTEKVPDVQQIMADANETLLELSLQSQTQANQLAQQNKQLQKQVTLDPLTGVANRGHFTEFLHTQFTLATSEQTDLGIIFIDADRFKSVNDTHGHLAGDAVLVSIAKVLADHCPEPGLLARYGGEEFALVLPGFTSVQTAQLAESLRVAVERKAIEADDNLTLHVTISVGVSAFNGRDFFVKPEQLIEAADKAVYVAKASGRNCVRVFVPRSQAPQPNDRAAQPTGQAI